MSRNKGDKAERTLVERLSAVVLADSYTNDFRPITTSTPRALLPLVNIALLDYTIEFLVSNGVEEVIIFCSSFAEMLEEHIQRSRWASNREVTVRCLVGKCTTPGDALRHLHEYDVIRGDFLLVPGDVVSNFTRLRDVITRHKLRRQSDPSFLLTLVFKESAPQKGQPPVSVSEHLLPRTISGYEIDEGEGEGNSQHDTYSAADLLVLGARTLEERVTVAIDPSKMHLLYYQPWYSTGFVGCEGDDLSEDLEDPSLVNINLQLLKDCPTISLRSDLVDTNIVVCSAELLEMFKQNFDFFDIKHDCVKGILEEELLGNKVAVDIIRPPFLERVMSIDHYASVSQAVMTRWTHPFVPDSDFGRRLTGQYHLQPADNVYISTSARLSRRCVTEQDLVVGADTVVEDGARLSKSVIGTNCRIGKGTRVENSYIWNNVQIGENCIIANSIVCNGCVLQDGAILSSGTVLAQGVVIGAGHITEPRVRVHIDSDAPDRAEQGAVGEGGKGVTWQPPKGGDQQDFYDIPLKLQAGSAGLQRDDDEDSIESEFEELLRPALSPGADLLTPHALPKRHRSDADDPTSPLGAGSGAGFGKVTEDQRFAEELRQTVHRAVGSNHDISNCMLEVNGLKFAYDKSFIDCARGILGALLDQANPDAFYNSFQELMKKKWVHLLTKFITGPDVQLEVLRCLTEEAAGRKGVAAAFPRFLMLFYDLDVAASETFFDWAAKVDQSGTPEEKALKAAAQPFLTWLKEAEEEEEDEEDED